MGNFVPSVADGVGRKDLPRRAGLVLCGRPAATGDSSSNIRVGEKTSETAGDQEVQQPLVADPVAEANSQFQCAPLRSRIFLNSVPKCGTVLLKNILLMFTPWEQHYRWFISTSKYPEHPSVVESDRYRFFVGHMNHTPDTSQILKNFKHILIIRDPYSYVLSYARWFYTEQMYGQSQLARHVQDHGVDFDDVVRYMIKGWHHYCPVKSRIESAGWGHRVSCRGSRTAAKPVKWAFSRIG